MRMEELSENRYLKRADTVEAYLLNLVQDYFEKVQTTPEGSMERIIEKCVARMDEELDYDGVGVTGILLPGDTEPRNGAVNISLELIGGEPIISPKRSAFNVDFGDSSNTACEGNDPRLSDARQPLSHTHTMADIQGLDGRISTIDGKITRALGLCHEHSNKTVLDKIIYSGNKETVDLADLETMQGRFDEAIENVRNDFTTLRATIEERIDDLNDVIDEINRTASQLYDYIIQKNEEYKASVNSYTDTKISEATTQMSAKLNDYVKKTELGPANETLSNVYTLVGSMTIPFSTYFTMDNNNEVHEFAISQDILAELSARTKTLNDCIFEVYLQYIRDGKNVHACLPYLSISDHVYKGMLTASVDTVNSKLVTRLYCENNSDTYTQELAISNIILRVLSKKDIVL